MTDTLERETTILGSYGGEMALDMVRTIRAAAASRSGDDYRPTLESVYLDGPQGVAVATDRYTMAIVPLPEGHGLTDAFQVPCDVVTALCKLTVANIRQAAKTSFAFLELTSCGDTVAATFEVGPSGRVTVTDTVTGTYPRWEQLIPSGSADIGTELPAVNASFLARTVKLGEALGADKAEITVQLVHAPDLLRATEWTVRAGRNQARFVQMPVRIPL
jgi:hypothetical protein